MEARSAGLGAHIRARRLSLQMTQEDLKRRLGYLDRSNISRMESGITAEFTPRTYAKLAAALEETVEEMLTAAGLVMGRDLPAADLTIPQERLIAFTRARLAHLSAEEADRLIRIAEAAFGERAPN